MPDKMNHMINKALSLSRRIVLVDGEDERVLAASAYLLASSSISPVLIGNEEKIRAGLHQLGVTADIEIHDPEKSRLLDHFAELYQKKLAQKGKKAPDVLSAMDQVKKPSYFGALLLETGKADGLVGGSSLPTADILKSSLEVIGLAEDSTVISGSFCMTFSSMLPSGADTLVFADCAVVPDPNAEQLAGIAINAVKIARRIADIEPVVAFLSFSTKGSADHPKIEKIKQAKDILSRKTPDIIMDGEFQADAALIPEIAMRKAPDSKVQGKANVLIFPDLNSGNIAYKLVERLAKAKALGVILEGFRKPVNDLSRGCSIQDIIDMVCVTSLQKQKNTQFYVQ